MTAARDSMYSVEKFVSNGVVLQRELEISISGLIPAAIVNNTTDMNIYRLI